MRTCYVNGNYVLENEAQISIFDRGFLFSDSVYEVTLILEGKLIDNDGHIKRLTRSLEKIGMQMPLSVDEITSIQKKLIEKNNLSQGGIYLQISRGSDGDRDFRFSDQIKPTVVMIPQEKDLINPPTAKTGIKVISLPEIRWAKRDIKTTGLLGAVLAKKTADEQGVKDAWFVEDGLVNEGSSSNVFIIKDNVIITKAANHQILNGITRQSVIKLAKDENLTIQERSFSVEEAQNADEAFCTAATALVIPIIEVDGVMIADGKPGQLSKKLREIYIEQAKLA